MTMLPPSAASLETMCAGWLAQAERDPDTILAIVAELDSLAYSFAPGDLAVRIVLRRARKRLDALRGSPAKLTMTRRTCGHG